MQPRYGPGPDGATGGAGFSLSPGSHGPRRSAAASRRARRSRRDWRMILTHSMTTPIVAPTTTTATGARYAICSSENFVTAAPASQITSTTSVIGIVRRQFTR